VSQRVFIFVNGILNRPGAHDGWTDRAVTWTHCRTFHRAEKWEYATDALTRRFLQDSRAKKVAKMIGFYERAGYDVVLVGHSNGCDIIARVLALRGQQESFYQRPIRSVHLFAPAADAPDFIRALDAGDVGRIATYTGGRDLALRVGKVSRVLFGWAGLGYGTAGLEERPIADRRVLSFHQAEFGHSTWLEKGERFEDTMRLIQANDEIFSNPIAA
jgi:pimeloyl-ACP methyl ester carboxylesterase